MNTVFGQALPSGSRSKRPARRQPQHEAMTTRLPPRSPRGPRRPWGSLLGWLLTLRAGVTRTGSCHEPNSGGARDKRSGGRTLPNDSAFGRWSRDVLDVKT
jgi:hypothetical protein